MRTLLGNEKDIFLELSDVYVLLNRCSELARCQRPIDEERDSSDNKKILYF